MTVRRDLESAKFTFEEAAKFLSSDKHTNNSMGLMTSSRTGSALQYMEELPAEVARLVANMKVGEVSEPFTMKDPHTSRDQVAIIKLRKRIDGHKATYYEDYQTLKDLYEKHLENEVIDKFIREKQRETYCKIKPGWEKYDFQYPGWGQR